MDREGERKMQMTKSQCSNEIVRNQTLIAQYESEIRGYQQQISELQETKTKLGVLQARLSDSKTASNTKLAETESLNKINSKIVAGFYAPECRYIHRAAISECIWWSG